jgi:hypothetical protein
VKYQRIWRPGFDSRQDIFLVITFALRPALFPSCWVLVVLSLSVKTKPATSAYSKNIWNFTYGVLSPYFITTSSYKLFPYISGRAHIYIGSCPSVYLPGACFISENFRISAKTGFGRPQQQSGEIFIDSYRPYIIRTLLEPVVEFSKTVQCKRNIDIIKIGYFYLKIFFNLTKVITNEIQWRTFCICKQCDVCSVTASKE